MPDLWGIDDQKIVQNLLKEASRKDPFGTRVLALLGIIGTVCLVCVILSAIVEKYVFQGRSFIFLNGALAGGLGVTAIGMWEKSRLRKHLPDVLKREGRCTKCGFALRESGLTRCPECGKDAIEDVPEQT